MNTMTLQEAIKQRIPRVRNAIWHNPNAYIRLPLFKDGTSGPWAELYDDETQEYVLKVNPGSQKIITMGDHMQEDVFEIYNGPISPHENDDGNFARAYVEN